jgi:predicted ATPase
MEEKSQSFLLDVLGIEDLESVLFVLKEPKSKWNNKDGDKRFFNARGLVQEFLSELWEFSLAPIYNPETIKIDFNREETQNRLYLFIKDKKQLQAFTKKYFDLNKELPNNTYLFKALESTYISSLLEEVKVKVKKRVDGKVTFKELSEGEQQLLTVIGLIMFTREKESLILLDEPDTHLNPLWKYDYLYYLRTLAKSQTKLNEKGEVEEDRTTQIIINTHDPLVIGSLDKSQVKLFRRDEVTNQIMAESPSVSPKGLGVAGILTSSLFGLPSTLDKDTLKKLELKNQLATKQKIEGLSSEEEIQLSRLFDELNDLGFSKSFRDPLYQKFIIALSQREEFKIKHFTEQELNTQNEIAQKILDELLNEEQE